MPPYRRGIFDDDSFLDESFLDESFFDESFFDESFLDASFELPPTVPFLTAGSLFNTGTLPRRPPGLVGEAAVLLFNFAFAACQIHWLAIVCMYQNAGNQPIIGKERGF